MEDIFGQRAVSRRDAFRALGAATAGIAAIGPASASEHQNENGNGKGRPSVIASSTGCTITLMRSSTGPPTAEVYVVATRSGETVETVSLDRGASEEVTVENGVYHLVSGHPAVVASSEEIRHRMPKECL